jgi:hypothetical protein
MVTARTTPLIPAGNAEGVVNIAFTSKRVLPTV